MGVGVLIFKSQEKLIESVPQTEKVDLQQRTLSPQEEKLLYGRLMKAGMWFKLNISSSDKMKLIVYVSIQRGTAKSIIFEKVGTSFTQEVPILETGTYWIETQNPNSFQVSLWGYVLVGKMQTKETYRTVFPYMVLGFTLLTGGISAVIFGVSRKPKKILKRKPTR